MKNLHLEPVSNNQQSTFKDALSGAGFLSYQDGDDVPYFLLRDNQKPQVCVERSQ